MKNLSFALALALLSAPAFADEVFKDQPFTAYHPSSEAIACNLALEAAKSSCGKKDGKEQEVEPGSFVVSDCKPSVMEPGQSDYKPSGTVTASWSCRFKY